MNWNEEVLEVERKQFHIHKKIMTVTMDMNKNIPRDHLKDLVIN